MKQFTSKELRNTWKKFYEERGHVDVGAVSLVSDGSTGVMFNVAGMQPLMPYLLGQKHPAGKRLCNVQGCVRTNDIDSVGDKSHVTFFEMMGSWSLGDYFKEERCKWSYELLTEVFGFDRDHLAATVFAGDENAPRDEEGAKFRIASGFKPENIYYLPAEDNWWGLEYGPCGPDSEMFYIADVEDCGKNCGPGCSCGKYTELGNDVFMQYEKHKDNSLSSLTNKNVDTGWGLERNLAFLNGTKDVYKTDLFVSVIEYIEKVSGEKYLENEKSTRSMRILADHIRTSVMLLGDAAKLVPSNAGAGYVLRRLIRRAVRHSRVLGLGKEDLCRIASMFIDDIYAEAYPLLVKYRSFVLEELTKEITRFEATIENGMKEFEKILKETKETGGKVFEGAQAFYLYDTFGFPLELTEELAGEEGLATDSSGFEKAMEQQKQKARESQSFKASLSMDGKVLFDEVEPEKITEFSGYDTLSDKGMILAVSDNSSLVQELTEGLEGIVVTDKTPFYATMGGQVGDIGIIAGPEGTFEVKDTIKLNNGKTGHVGVVINGSIKSGSRVEMRVDNLYRGKICRNHSSTHLLHKALRQVLGDSVEQAGSYQDSNRTRFDFSYGKAMTKEELLQVENIVNQKIMENLSVNTEVLSLEDAKKTGAMALFDEKYGDTVRVVSMGDFSKELCGGTHVKETGDIQIFKIISESGIAAGVRRIEAYTGSNVYGYYRNLEDRINEACGLAKTSAAELPEKIKSMNREIKELQSELAGLKAKAARDAAGDLMDSQMDISGVKVILAQVSGMDMNSLRDMGDSIKNKLGQGVILLASDCDGRVNLMAMATDEAVNRGAHAGNLIKTVASLVGGGGGGKPSMAQAGGKNPAGIKECLRVAEDCLKSQLG